MIFYIIISGIYRLSCGALILAINWLMVADSNSFSRYAFMTALTFLPATVVPFLWKNSSGYRGDKMTGISLLFSSLLAVALFLSLDQKLILLFNTLLWFFFFVMESSWESWFANLVSGYSSDKAERMSAISMSVNQSCLMLGPICVGFFFEYIPRNAIACCGLIFVVLGIAILYSIKKLSLIQIVTPDQSVHKLAGTIKIGGTEIALLLIWPTLAMFNFMLPAQIVYNKGNMIDVGILDAVMGGGMIASGFLLNIALVKTLLTKYKLNLLLLIIGTVIWSQSRTIFVRGAAVFLLGLSFNMARIAIRSTLAKRYNSQVVGKLVSGANSFSFFIISLSLYAFYNIININWILPYVFAGVICLLISPKVDNKSTQLLDSEKGDLLYRL